MAEKANPPSGSPAGCPVMMRVVREEIPLSRREGDEIMKRRLSGESRSPSPPPFGPSTIVKFDSDLFSDSNLDVSLLDMDLW